MKSIPDLANIPDFYNKPWIVVGTGPSIEKFSQLGIDLDNYNIWAINHAVLYIKCVTIASLVDKEAIKEIHDYSFWAMAILTKQTNCKVYRRNIYTFNYSDDLVINKKLTTLPTSCSSSLAFLILGKLGIRKIFTLGLDGGISIKHPFFDAFLNVQNSKNLQIDYDFHNSGCQHWCNHFDIEWVKL